MGDIITNLRTAWMCLAITAIICSAGSSFLTFFVTSKLFWKKNEEWQSRLQENQEKMGQQLRSIQDDLGRKVSFKDCRIERTKAHDIFCHKIDEIKTILNNMDNERSSSRDILNTQLHNIAISIGAFQQFMKDNARLTNQGRSYSYIKNNEMMKKE